uniref:Uncharacterized protein n=2 Tax=Photinus pyralis TaxID=7054 RepID=A0A1Y1KRL2_PHOPY
MPRFRLFHLPFVNKILDLIKMSTSPNKSRNVEKHFSPITLPQSPAGISSHKNLTGLPRVARDIVADLYNNIQRWNDNHIRGANITKSIAHLKTNNIADYSKDLENLTSDLFDVVEKLSGISEAFDFLCSQMKSLVKLHKKTTTLFISMRNEQLADFVEAITSAYKGELKVKKFVLENIAHAKNKNEVMFYAVCWAHQQKVNVETNVKLEALLTETGHRRIM